MSDIREILQKIGAGEPEAVATFGLERRYSRGRWRASSQIYEWDQRLLISGRGTARMAISRSLGDMGGQPAGVYQTQFPVKVIPQIAQAILESGILDHRCGHVEPGDLMARFRLVAGGMVHDTILSMDEVPEEASVREFLSAIRRLEGPILAKPLRTVHIDCEVTGKPVAGKRSRLPLTMRLRNEGTQGHWLIHPAAMTPDGTLERRFVTYCPTVQETPGVTPILPSFVFGVLEPTTAITDPERRLLWLDAGSSVEIPCTAVVNFASAGRYYFKLGYMTFEGEPVHEGQARWAGAVFSEAQVVEAS